MQSLPHRSSGALFFAAGTLADEFQRPVNDRAFDVALHVVFTDRAAHDAYQQAPRHLKFIEENKPNWKEGAGVRCLGGRGVTGRWRPFGVRRLAAAFQNAKGHRSGIWPS